MPDRTSCSTKSLCFTDSVPWSSVPHRRKAPSQNTTNSSDIFTHDKGNDLTWSLRPLQYCSARCTAVQLFKDICTIACQLIVPKTLPKHRTCHAPTQTKQHYTWEKKSHFLVSISTILLCPKQMLRDTIRNFFGSEEVSNFSLGGEHLTYPRWELPNVCGFACSAALAHAACCGGACDDSRNNRHVVAENVCYRDATRDNTLR